MDLDDGSYSDADIDKLLAANFAPRGYKLKPSRNQAELDASVLLSGGSEASDEPDAASRGPTASIPSGDATCKPCPQDKGPGQTTERARVCNIELNRDERGSYDRSLAAKKLSHEV
eukprot:2315787-Pleurochrysis_carterae.AAC.1